ncbi:MAG: SNF2 family helicase [Kiritimatiellaceae bacterium]|nr:SNF2 family helicase [Kiritimatiellaceae bacterium]
MALPFTQKILKDWAGWKAYRDGKLLYERGVVEKMVYEHPIISGQLAVGIRGMRCKFELLDDGFVENLCPCRDNQEKGLICAHMVALGLDAIRQHSDPQRELKEEEEKRRARRQEQFDDSNYIKRVPEGHPSAIPAILRITLKQSWRDHVVEDDVIPIRCAAEYQDQVVPLNEVPKDLPLAFSPRDENLLFVLEDISEGPAKGKLKVAAADFINILRLSRSRPIYEGGVEGYLKVAASVMQTFIRMVLDEETGELVLSIHPRAGGEQIKPLYISGGRTGWMFSNRRFCQLEQLLPGPMREIYKNDVRIPRTAVPAFMEKEFPMLAKSIPVETDISSDLFTLEPAKPRFRLVVSGSPASLSAKLYAEYGNIVLIACREETAGHFAISDPDDLLGYQVRDLDAEKQALEKMAPTGFRGYRGDLLTSIVGTRDVLNFLGASVPKLRRFGWRVELEGRVAPFMDEAEFTTTIIHVNESSSEGFFEVGYEYENSGGQSLSEMEIQRALNMGEAFVEKNGRTILLDIDAIETAREVFNDCAFGEGGSAGTFRMNDIYAAYVKSSLDALDGIDVEAAPGWMQKAREQSRDTKMEAEPIGNALETTLRAYQKEGVYWLRFLERSGFSGILADEMGLGKTLQTLTWLQMERTDEAARSKPSLIVCPTSLVDNWGEEAQKFTPSLNVIRLHGADRHELWEQIGETDLVVTSYALLRRDLDKYLEFDFAITVLDEAQHIKNRSTQNAKAAKQIKSIHKLVLTGTPIENSVADLWSIMDFLMPGYLSNHKAFREHYELPISRGGPDADLAQIKLRRKLNPFLMRRLKKEVAKDLPDKIQRVAYSTLSKDQHMVYKQLLESAKRKINDMVEEQGFNKSRMQILKTLLRLRQTCCHLELLKLPNLQSEFPSAKMELFFELVEEALDARHRILVFSQFTSMLSIIRRELDERGMKYCYLDGATKDRQAMVREFNTDRSIPIFLISLKAGGSGLNLTGADMVIHFDPWWNPAVEDQATDRAHRIGQKNTVYSVKLITKNTVEEKVLAMQQRKKSVIDATLEKEGEFTQSLSWEDVQELLTL